MRHNTRMAYLTLWMPLDMGHKRPELPKVNSSLEPSSFLLALSSEGLPCTPLFSPLSLSLHTCAIPNTSPLDLSMELYSIPIVLYSLLPASLPIAFLRAHFSALKGKHCLVHLYIPAERITQKMLHKCPLNKWLDRWKDGWAGGQ